MKRFLVVAAASLALCALALVPAFAEGTVASADSAAAAPALVALEGSPDAAADDSPTDASDDSVYLVHTMADLQQGLAEGANCKLANDIVISASEVTSSGYFTVKGNAAIDFAGKRIIMGKRNETFGGHPFEIDEGASLLIYRSGRGTSGGITSGPGVTFGEDALIVLKASATLEICHDIYGFTKKEGQLGLIDVPFGGKVVIDGGSVYDCTSEGGSPIIRILKGELEFKSGSIEGCAVSGECLDFPNAIVYAKGNSDSDPKVSVSSEASFAKCTVGGSKKTNAIISVSGKSASLDFAGLIYDCEIQGTGAPLAARDGGSITVSGGTITNVNSQSSGAVYLEGIGDDCIYTPTLTMTGGTFGKTINALGSTVYLGGGAEFQMTDGTIYGAKKCNNGGCITVETKGEFTMTGGKLLGCSQEALFYGGCIYCRGSAYLWGGTIDGNTCQAVRGGLVYLAGRTDKLQSSATGQEDGVGQTSAAGQDGEDNGITPYLRIEGATLINGLAIGSLGEQGCGGGVYLEEGSRAVMRGSSIIDGCLANGAGGGVYTCASLWFSGGTISNCQAYDPQGDLGAQHSTYGGGIYVAKNSIDADGGKVEGCSSMGGTAATTKGYGGGVCIAPTAEGWIGLRGGSICNCKAKTDGGGVIDLLPARDAAEIKLAGNIRVEGNTAAAGASNLLLAAAGTTAPSALSTIVDATDFVGACGISISGDLATSWPIAFANAKKNVASCFTSDDALAVVRYDEAAKCVVLDRAGNGDDGWDGGEADGEADDGADGGADANDGAKDIAKDDAKDGKKIMAKTGDGISEVVFLTAMVAALSLVVSAAAGVAVRKRK